MEAPEHRKWMDKRVGPNKRRVTDEFMAGVFEFVEFACSQDSYKREGKLRCPCKKCQCLRYRSVDEVKTHLCMKGFMSDYYYWTNHNEQRPVIPPLGSNNSYYGSSGVREGFNDYEQMVMDAAGPPLGNFLEQQGLDCGDQMREDPNPEAKIFFDMLAAAQAPLYNGCESYSELSVAELFKWLEQDEDKIRKCFNSRGSLAYKNAMFKVRKVEDKGEWIGQDLLDQLRAKWEAEDWQQKSIKNKENRLAQDGHNVHSAGSLSTREHAKRMRKEMDKEPTCFELYERFHRPKGKPNEWHNEKQGKIAEMYQSQIVEKQSQSGEGSSQQSANSIYLEIVGGINKKERIFGLGSQATTLKNSSTSQSISTDGASSGEVATMKAKIDALTAELQQKNLEQEKMNVEQEKLKQKMDQWEQKFERLMLQNNVPVLPPEPAGENVDANEDFGDDEINNYDDLA
ncbi:Transposase-associated domain [Sesbania bispinosa]|nr:Transposase-associated domain [Sesbania bispinosa]